MANILIEKSEHSEAKQAKRHRATADLLAPDVDNIKILQTIQNVSPAYAKRTVLETEIIGKALIHNGGGLEILEQPVCRSCERPAFWDEPNAKGEPMCGCLECHVHTTNPITVLEYMRDQIKGFSDEYLELLAQAARKEVNADGVTGDTNSTGKIILP